MSRGDEVSYYMILGSPACCGRYSWGLDGKSNRYVLNGIVTEVYILSLPPKEEGLLGASWDTNLRRQCMANLEPNSRHPSPHPP